MTAAGSIATVGTRLKGAAVDGPAWGISRCEELFDTIGRCWDMLRGRAAVLRDVILDDDDRPLCARF